MHFRLKEANMDKVKELVAIQSKQLRFVKCPSRTEGLYIDRGEKNLFLQLLYLTNMVFQEKTIQMWQKGMQAETGLSSYLCDLGFYCPELESGSLWLNKTKLKWCRQ